MSDSWNLKPFQMEVLKVFRAFESICVRHNLKYYAFGGTALGAVRHHGFIPWDDDFDVAMPREDFCEFLKFVGAELPGHLVFRRGGDSCYSPIYFSKIINVEDGVIERICKETGLEFDFPPFIDIFVLDGVPEDVRDFGKWWRSRRLLRFVQLYRFPETGVCTFASRCNLKYLLARMVGALLSPFYPRTRTNVDMMSLVDQVALKWPFATSPLVAEVAFFRFMARRLFSKAIFEPAREISFEDGTIRVPAQVEDMLTGYFGDYMTPPPEEHRVPEHLLKRAYNHV